MAPDTPGPLLERERELDRLRALIERARGGRGAAVLVEGAAGIGKSRLLAACLDAAREAQLRTLRAHGGELERELSWAVVRDLFGPTVHSADGREELLTGAARLAEPLLSPEVGEARPEGPEALAAAFHALYWLTSNLAERQPLAIVVDDCHWADRPSIRFLAYLAQRIEDLPVLLCLAARPAEPDAEHGLLAELADRAVPIRPRPLSEEGATELVRRELSEEPEREFAQACHGVTGGNPFLLTELCSALRSEGVRPRESEAARLTDLNPEAISHSVLIRLARMPDPSRDLVQAVAVLGTGIAIRRAAALAGLSEDEAAQAARLLAEQEIIDPALPISIVHPLMRHAIYETIPAPRRMLFHRTAAELARDAGDRPEEVARHLLRVEPTADPVTVEAFREAAREARARGAPESAAAYLRRALAEPPPEESRAGLLIELGEAESLSGIEAATERLEEALPLLDEPDQRAAVRLRLGYVLHRAGRPAEAADQLESGLREVRDDAELEAELQTAHLAIAMLLDRLSAADLEARIEEIAPRPLRRLTAAERERLGYQAIARVCAARDHEGAVRLATWALDEGAWLVEKGVTLDLSFTVGCLFWADALEEAEDVIEQALEWARREGDFTTQAYAHFGLSQPGYWRGRLAEAATNARAAIEAWRETLGMHLAFAGVWATLSLIELDQLQEAETALAASRPRADAAPVYEASYRSGLARILLARGDGAAAREEFRAVERLAEGIPYLQNPTTNPWRSDAALAALACGEREEASLLAFEELRIAERFGAPRPLGVALRTTGIVEGGEAGLTRLRDSVSVLGESPARFELCRSLLELGAAHRRAGHRTEAREHLRQALALAHEFGAARTERRALEELQAAGARPRRAARWGPESLTPAERRVATLAAGGATNREIAQQLFLSLRTVETHLTHAYGKLEISSRGELPAALAPQGG